MVQSRPTPSADVSRADADPWITVAEAAKQSDVSVQTVYDWIRRGHLVIEMQDGPTRVRGAEVQRLRDLRRVAAHSRLRIATVRLWADELQGIHSPYWSATEAP